ncbi:FadR family transcriptional regulator [Pseudoclavibacter sp. CFCC 13796]|nr:FadR family transcriptional regulator [Pseudoclavibacter sp. CFCC 13796]
MSVREFSAVEGSLMSSVPGAGALHRAVEPFAIAFDRVKPTRDTVIRGILSVVERGEIAPGQRFPPERELAKSMGVSRDTLREAIRALSQLGYVETRRGRYGGTFVCEDLPQELRAAPHSASSKAARHGPKPAFSQSTQDHDTQRNLAESPLLDQVAELVSTLRVVQIGAIIQLAAAHDLDNRVAALYEHQRQIAGSDVAFCRSEDARFHLTLVRLSGLKHLVDPTAEVWSQVVELLQQVPSTTCTRATNNDVHLRIAHALQERRVDDAVETERLHLATLEWVLRNEL